VFESRPDRDAWRLMSAAPAAGCGGCVRREEALGDALVDERSRPARVVADQHELHAERARADVDRETFLGAVSSSRRSFAAADEAASRRLGGLSGAM
jgi:hypothetical protein